MIATSKRLIEIVPRLESNHFQKSGSQGNRHQTNTFCRPTLDSLAPSHGGNSRGPHCRFHNVRLHLQMCVRVRVRVCACACVRVFACVFVCVHGCVWECLSVLTCPCLAMSCQFLEAGTRQHQPTGAPVLA